jgi:bifunctional non-homologous end joining protein LigD
MLHEVKPMLTKIRDKPFDSPDWLFEIKWDGYRAIAEVERGSVSLYSRNNLSFSHRYPAVVRSLEKLDFNAVLDGEIVVLDKDGKPRFQNIQQYDPAGANPIIYYVFDILYLDGYDLRNVPLLKRKEKLKEVLPEGDPVLRYSDHIMEKGLFLFGEMKKQNLEGVIAKRTDSRYLTGTRSSEWLKIKTSLMQEAVIAGFTEPRGSRKDFGALILGVYKDGRLTYVGHTGGGFNTSSLKEVKQKLTPLVQETSPFEKKIRTNTPVTWVKPILVCEVSFSEWTNEGHMRHPVFQGLRVDKSPEEVVIETEDAQQPETAALLILPGEKSKKTVVDGHRLSFSNTSKIYWPGEKYTKGDVLNYYHRVAKLILPYLKDRAQSLHRHPNGIKGGSFYHKDAGGEAPSWMKKTKVKSESEDRYIHYVMCQDEASLLYLANLGCIEINPWNSRYRSRYNPDYIVIDLDPSDGNTFDQVIETALAVKEVLDQAGAPGYCKTSGASGLHIYVPLEAKYDYEQAKEFARILAYMTHDLLPDITTVERTVKSRGNKIYVDFLQNRIGQTLASAYSLRPKPGATVSTPLRWEELKAGLHPSLFTIKTIHGRIEKLGDIFTPVLGKGIDMQKCLNNLGA